MEFRMSKSMVFHINNGQRKNHPEQEILTGQTLEHRQWPNNQEHLKPQLAGGLANCELYCSALANIYSDPGYNNLNHSAILQTLARKGVLEPSDDANRNLTETTLIQTNPLRMAAHTAVIDHLMRLYAREVATPERVQAAAQRFAGDRGAGLAVQSEDPEQLLLAWVGGACAALTERLNQEAGQNGTRMVNGGGDAGDEVYYVL
nr:unnamed protein product [Callosobruchus analis]